MSDSFLRQRQCFEDISGTLLVAPEDTEPTAVSARPVPAGAFETIYIQRGSIDLLNQGVPGTTWTLADDQGAFISPDYPVGSDDPQTITFNFGAIGRPLTEGAGFILVLSAPGTGGYVTFEGYRKLTGIGAT